MPVQDTRLPAAVVDVLACPVCGEGLLPSGSALHCVAGHAFDVARQGYVSLLTGGARGPADSAEMVRARVDFLATGGFAPLAGAVAGYAARACREQGVILDAGVGTGHYLAAALEAAPTALGLGLDTSKYALRRAARAHPRAGAAACDLWSGVPVRGGGVDVVLNVFSPRNPKEFHRVLRPGGTLVVARPTPRHLAELRAGLDLVRVDPDKERRLHKGLAARFRLREERLVQYRLDLAPSTAADALLMGPTARHLGAEPVRRAVSALAENGRVAATASVVVSVYRPS